ncbi:hypothetical protein, partial [Escherichia coli]
MTYVEDAARAHLLAEKALDSVDSPVAGSVYFISQDEPVNMWNFVNELFEKLDVPPIKRQLSPKLAHNLGALVETIYKTFRLK